MEGSISSFVGIDVAKRSFDVCILPDATASPVSACASFKHDSDNAGRQDLLKKLPIPGSCSIVLEATGGYERLLVAELIDAGHQVAVVNPRQVRDYAKALGVLGKTDRLDASVLARFARDVRPRLAAHVTQKQADLEQLVVRRRQLVEMRTMEKNRMQVLDAKAVRKNVQQMIDQLNKHIRRLEKQIAASVASDDDWRDRAKLIESVPGIGPVVSATLVAEVPELGHISRKEIASLVGLAPFNQDSGQFHGQRSIRGGRNSVRSALYMAALSASRSNPVIRAFAERLAAMGKKPKVILTACMRKLLVILNSMVKNNTHWNQQPA